MNFYSYSDTYFILPFKKYIHTHMIILKPRSLFGSFYAGIFVFLYFGHLSCMIFLTMCSVCLFFLACLALHDKQTITYHFGIFVTSLTKTKNEKWNEINIRNKNNSKMKIHHSLVTRLTVTVKKFCIFNARCFSYYLLLDLEFEYELGNPIS